MSADIPHTYPRAHQAAARSLLVAAMTALAATLGATPALASPQPPVESPSVAAAPVEVGSINPGAAAPIEFGVNEAVAALGAPEPWVYAVGGALIVLAVGLVVLARRFQFDLDAVRHGRTPALAEATVEPSRSVLLNAPPEDAEPPPPEPEASPEPVRPWMNEFFEPPLELPPRPSVDYSARALAQLPPTSGLQVPLPPPLQPSLPPPPSVVIPTSEPASWPVDGSPSRPRGGWLTAGSLALGVALTLWATIATVMLATQPEVDRSAIDSQIAALEARVAELTAQVAQPEGTPTPSTVDNVAASTPEAGAPPVDTATHAPSLAELADPTEEAVATAEPEPVETEASEPTSVPTPLATSQAIEIEPPEEETAIPGGETWNVGPNGERVYFAGPGGGPLDSGGQDLYDCHNFETWAQALAVSEASGAADPNLIDTDGNGLPCESLMAREQSG